MEESKKYYRFDANIVSELSRKHRNHSDEADEYNNFLIYSDNEYPKELINKQRPNEQPAVKLYREETYEPVFSEVFMRVLNALNRIQRADGFFLKYPDQSQFTRIAEGEKLEDYLTRHFTASKSLMNWAFQVCLKQYIIDANGVCVVWSEQTENETEYFKPVPYIVNIDRIVYHFEGHSLMYIDEHEKRTWYTLDDERWAKWTQDRRGNVTLVEERLHGLGIFPAFTLGGIVEEEEELGREYESRLKAMLPWLNVATIEFSDLRAEITMHIHSKEWAYQDEQCPQCNGFGYILRENEKVPCTNSRCKGGYVGHSPYEIIRVRPAVTNMGEAPAPIPPGGYIQKQTEIARLQAERIDAHRYRALAAINMQFLEQVPTAQSGVAKAYDRDETNNTFYGIATDLAQIMEKIAYLVAKWRYGMIYDDATLRSMCPICVVPNNYDIVGSQFLLDEVKQSKDSKLNDSVISQIEIEYIKKRFPNDTRLQNVLINSYQLDPMSGLTEDEKALLMSNRGATKQDYIISTYISDFINKAYDEYDNFGSKTRDEQHNILNKYAEEKLKEINNRDKLVTKIFGIDTTSNSADAKGPADLKYTVGGLTGIIEIVKAVSSGVYDLEAAIQMVMDRFGLTYEQAKAQLGTPQIITSEAQLDKVTKLT